LRPGVLRRDHVEERAQAKLALEQPPADREVRDAERRVDEQLDRVVAGLAVDVDRAGEVRGAVVIQPVVVAEPAIRQRDRHQLAGTGMVETERALALLIQDLLDAV
jgi:hypothetical protein